MAFFINRLSCFSIYLVDFQTILQKKNLAGSTNDCDGIKNEYYTEHP